MPFVAGAHRGHLYVDRSLYREGKPRRWCDNTRGPAFADLVPHRPWTWPWFDAYRAQGAHVAVDGGCGACQARWERWNAPDTGRQAKAMEAIAEACPNYSYEDDGVHVSVLVSALRGLVNREGARGALEREGLFGWDEWPRVNATAADQLLGVVLGRPSIHEERNAASADCMERIHCPENQISGEASKWWLPPDVSPYGSQDPGRAYDAARYGAERLARAVLDSFVDLDPYPRPRVTLKEGQVWYLNGWPQGGLHYVSDVGFGCQGEPWAVIRNWFTGEPSNGGIEPGERDILILANLHPLPSVPYGDAPQAEVDAVVAADRADTAEAPFCLSFGQRWVSPTGQELEVTSKTSYRCGHVSTLCDPSGAEVRQIHTDGGSLRLWREGWRPVISPKEEPLE